MLNVELKVVSGKHAGQVITLNRAKFLIGREQDCQLRPNSELVSRHHCVFTVDDFSVRVRDLGSTNGTTVNGERIRKEILLQQGDHVIVGNLEFEVVINENTKGQTSPAVSSEDTVVAGTDTITEMAAVRSEDATPAAESEPQQPAQPAQPAPEAVTQMLPVVPASPAGSGDTTVIEQPAMLPGQVPYHPMMPPMGYPMYGGFPYQPMPGQMPMYPQQFPGASMPEMAPTGDSESKTAKGPNISLPDPSQTGAKDEPPKPAAPEVNSGDKKQEMKSDGAADAIIKQFMQRRPGR